VNILNKYQAPNILCWVLFFYLITTTDVVGAITTSFDSARVTKKIMQLSPESAMNYLEEQVQLLLVHQDYLFSAPVIAQTLYHVRVLYSVIPTIYIDEKNNRLYFSRWDQLKSFTNYLCRCDNNSFQKLCVLYCDALSRAIIPLLQEVYDKWRMQVPTHEMFYQFAQSYVNDMQSILQHLALGGFSHERYSLQLKRYLELIHIIQFTTTEKK